MPQITSLLAQPKRFTNGRDFQTAYTEAEAHAAVGLGYKEVFDTMSPFTDRPHTQLPHNKFNSQHPQMNSPTVIHTAEFAKPGPPSKFPTARYHQTTGAAVVVQSEEELAALGADFGEVPVPIPEPPVNVTTPSLAALAAYHETMKISLVEQARALENMLRQHAQGQKTQGELEKRIDILSAQLGELGQLVIKGGKKA